MENFFTKILKLTYDIPIYISTNSSQRFHKVFADLALPYNLINVSTFTIANI